MTRITLYINPSTIDWKFMPIYEYKLAYMLKNNLKCARGENCIDIRYKLSCTH